MNIEVKKNEDFITVSLEGKLDQQSSPRLKERLFSLIADGERQIVIDLEKLNYISSIGLSTLLQVAKRVKAVGGELVISTLQEAVKEIFQISGFDSLFIITPSLEEVQTHFRKA